MTPERHGLATPGVICGVEDLHAVLVEDGENAALLVGEYKMTIYYFTFIDYHLNSAFQLALQNSNGKSGANS